MNGPKQAQKKPNQLHLSKPNPLKTFSAGLMSARVFAQPEDLALDADLARKVNAMEKNYDAQFKVVFDSRRNGGRDALTPLSGAFSWDQVALARPTPDVAFDFRFGYSSANAFGGFKLGSSNPFDAGPLGPGWRHTFETRLVRSEDFDPGGDADSIGLMS